MITFTIHDKYVCVCDGKCIVSGVTRTITPEHVLHLLMSCMVDFNNFTYTNKDGKIFSLIQFKDGWYLDDDKKTEEEVIRFLLKISGL